MERRKAVAVAAATSATLLLGAAGLTANATILGDHGGGGVGTVSPVTAPIGAGTSAAERGLDRPATTLTPTTAGAPAPTVGSPAPTPAPAPAGGSPAPQVPNGYTGPTYRIDDAPRTGGGGSGGGGVGGGVVQAPAPTPTTSAPTTHTGASPTTGSGGGTEVEGHDDDHGSANESEHEDDHENEHEGTEGSENDD
jgi:hypothetical protein